MNVAIYPGMVVDRDTVVTADVLNAGFSPTGSLLGAVESTDLPNGVLSLAKLSTALISGRGPELPTAQHRLWHQTGAQSGRTTIGAVPAVLPAYLFAENGYEQAEPTSTTHESDKLVFRTPERVVQAPLGAVVASNVTTAGTYQAGEITIDAKGRVLSTAPGNHWTTGWVAFPPPGTTYSYDHTLGRQPAIMHAWIKCIAPDAGYQSGEIVPASLVLDFLTFLPYLTYFADAARFRVYARTTGAYPLIAVNYGGSPLPMNLSKWQLVINLKL